MMHDVRVRIEVQAVVPDGMTGADLAGHILARLGFNSPSAPANEHALAKAMAGGKVDVRGVDEGGEA